MAVIPVADQRLHKRQRALRELAVPRGGMATRSELTALGFGSRTIDRRVASGAWKIPLPSVIQVFPAELHASRLWSASLWAPTGSCLSHRCAARLHDLDGHAGDLVEMWTELRRRSSAAYLVLHFARHALPRDHVKTLANGLRVTSIPRTIIDLAAVTGRDELEAALDCALRRGQVTVAHLERQLHRIGSSGRPGVATLRELLRRSDAEIPHGSVAEQRLTRILRRHRLPLPSRQMTILDDRGSVARVDFAYAERRLCIEIYGSRWHFGAHAWQQDLRRENRIASSGWRLLRFLYRDLRTRPDDVAAEVAAALGVGALIRT